MKTFHHEYGDINPKSEYGYSPGKAAFHRDWKRVLTAVVKHLRLTDAKVKSALAGPAVLGDVMIVAPKAGLFVQASVAYDMPYVLFRKASEADPYGARSADHFLHRTDDPRRIADHIRAIIKA